MKYFGTDGIRGVANVHPLTANGVASICFHAGRLLCEANTDIAKPLVLLGRDTRASGDWMAAAAGAGFASAGCDVWDAGVLPTPAISLLVRLKPEARLGVVLSASHNPAPDNGLKFFQATGGKASQEFEEQLEARMETDATEEQATLTGEKQGAFKLWHDAEQAYVITMTQSFQSLDLTGWKILFDGAHGAAFRTTPAVLEALGAKVEALNVSPDGQNINEDCGALHPQSLQEKVKEGGYDLGILHDGDADRGFLVDSEGNLLDGEDFLYLLATETDPPPKNVVGTVMNNLGLENALKSQGIGFTRSAVGDKHVRHEMEKNNSPFGGEPSGHIIVDRLGATGDGLGACLAVLEAVSGDSEKLKTASQKWKRYPQVLLGLKVKSKPPLTEIPGYPDFLAECEAKLTQEGRVLVRYSGTEPKVRVMVEAKDASLAQSCADDLVAFLKGAIA